MRIPPYHHHHRPTGLGDLTGVWVVCAAAAIATGLAMLARLLLGD
jgi:hypothetical protein